MLCSGSRHSGFLLASYGDMTASASPATAVGPAAAISCWGQWAGVGAWACLGP